MIISLVFKTVYAHLYTYIHVFKCPQRPEVRFTQLLKIELQVIMSDIEAGIQLASSRRAGCTLDHRANSLGLDLSLNCMWVWKFCDVPSQSLKKPLRNSRVFLKGGKQKLGGSSYPGNSTERVKSMLCLELVSSHSKNLYQEDKSLVLRSYVMWSLLHKRIYVCFLIPLGSPGPKYVTLPS